MDYLIVWSAVVAASVLSLNLFWSVIERPFIEFLALGQVPGTGVFLSYEQILLVSLTIFSTWFMIEHLDHVLSGATRRKLGAIFPAITNSRVRSIRRRA